MGETRGGGGFFPPWRFVEGKAGFRKGAGLGNIFSARRIRWWVWKRRVTSPPPPPPPPPRPGILGAERFRARCTDIPFSFRVVSTTLAFERQASSERDRALVDRACVCVLAHEGGHRFTESTALVFFDVFLSGLCVMIFLENPVS